MASATIDFGIGRILSVLENETLLLSGVYGEIEKMKKELLIMESFLEDTQHARNGSTTTTTQLFQTFVANMRDLSYQVEDIIDEFAYHIHGYRSCNNLWRAFHFPRYMWARHSIAQKLGMVNVMIQSISDSMRSENSLVGIDAAKGKLIGWLLTPEPQRIVTSVVGMGGSGKTTLAANIFKSQSVRKHFESNAWVTISKSYVIEDVFRNMIKEFYKEAQTQIPAELYSLSYRELVEKLVEYLQSKRYIVVLDDVWTTGLWREISIALPDGICGSRVMITTRSMNVASFSYGIGSQKHEIELLKEDEAWVLFCNRAFSGSLEQCRERNLEPIARKLLERCQGLPLAIASLGSMMSTKKLESEWKKVYSSLNWELNNNLELKVVRSILLLSFNDLPYPLKRCFLYCSLFPVNYGMKRKRLVRMWMAQRFVEPIRGVKAEEVADGYLNELVYRNMLQVILWNPFGRPKAFKMHDVIREIALSISKTERFSDVYNGDNDDDHHHDDGETTDTRHLCIQREMRPGSIRTTNLHSLLVCSSAKHNIKLPLRLNFLRALDLEHSAISKLPDCLVTLFNLKYLNLSKTQVKTLPKNFHKLINLETLNTKHSKIEELPPGMSKLQKLRHLITFRRNDGHDSNWNYVLGTRVSPKIWQLKDLQVMDCFNAETELIKNLGNMTQLTRISLVMVRREHGGDLCNSLNKIKRLRFLSLTSVHEEEPLEIDDLIATASIEKLFLAGKLERVPSWFNTLQNVTYLGLRGSQLQGDTILSIQTLPKLVWLSLYNAYMGPRLCFAQGFQSLKILDIVQMQHLTEVVVEGGAMFGLQKLYVRACRELEAVPKGIENLKDLQELHLTQVSDQLVQGISGEGSVDRSRVKHIPAIKHFFRTDKGTFYVSLSS
ncbi:PREDICTED: disease resistance protein RPM1-like isoform X2 [Camelina sativa]|uniref:Disease resistance protein RPM1-like isoform X2 n=1 Tax=Camelina sativa TaxID=90675 RepID=A0ABM0XHW5_CAMSA|nr:PREDICTED: disease resistance protein RPM1-like isoform X2 [Camelina sativa]